MKNRKDNGSMKNRKAIAAVGIILCMGMMIAGCGKTAEDGSQTEVGKWAIEEDQAEDVKKAEQEDQTDAAGQEGGTDSGDILDSPWETEHLGGKVQSPQPEGMTVLQITILGEDGTVTMLDEKDAKKITVKFTQETKAEHWIIQGGGKNIDMNEAALSDLEEGMLVELEGYFVGDEYIATKVIIEEYT